MTSLVGRLVPDFTAAAVLANGEIDAAFQLSKEIQNKYAIIFFYPLDFTFVCPSELIALNKRSGDFQARNTQIIAISIDSQFAHLAWRNTAISAGGIGHLNFPLVADVTHGICQAFAIEHPSMSVALRAAFLVDKSGVVRAQIVNDLPLGRSIDELLRLVDALQFHEQHGEVCPANWLPGKAAITPTQAGIALFLADEGENL
jgi:peroxiredoxin (alkyl hydroperoxide reductase subunit C)